MNYKEFWKEKASEPDHRKYILPSRTPEEFEAEGKAQAEWLQQYIEPTDTVMEFGCGVGRVLKYIKAAGRIGVDVSEKFLDEARQSGIITLLSNGITLNIDSETIDFVYSIMVFQHCDRIDHHLQLIEIMRVLKPGGKALIQFPKSDSGYYTPSSFVNVYTYKQVTNIANGIRDGLPYDFGHKIFQGDLVGYADRKTGQNREWFLLITK